MKRAVMAVLVLGLVMGLGITGAFAQQVKWGEAYGPYTPGFNELSASRSLYGIEKGGAIVAIDLTRTVNVTDTLVPTAGASFVDLAASSKETVFAINDTTVVTWTASAVGVLDPQPKVPFIEGATKGTFKNIALGKGGKVYVLFEAPNGLDQYILTGQYPQGALEARIEPQTLNVVSKGKWVSCKIGLPTGYSEKDIDLSTVEIINIQAEGKSATETIFIASGAPVSVDNKDLHVKFSRAELVSAVGDVLGGAAKGKYPVTVTIRAQLKESAGGEIFEGDAVFQAIIPKTKG
jgi:hypothetical protein